MTPCFVCKSYPWPHGVQVFRCWFQCLCWLLGCWSSWFCCDPHPVLHLPEGSAVSGIASNQLGLHLSELELYTLMQQHDPNSCTMTEFVENLESLPPLSLSPTLLLFCFYFYFPTPSKEVLMRNVHRKETSKSYFSDNQWKVAVCVNWLLFVRKPFQLTSKSLVPKEIWPLCLGMIISAKPCHKILKWPNFYYIIIYYDEVQFLWRRMGCSVCHRHFCDSATELSVDKLWHIN